MKVLVSNYTFNKSQKTVSFTGYTSINLENVLIITNVTSNQIIYSFADPLLGGTVATNILTLDFDTSSMNNADKLQIYYDDTSISPATQETLLLLKQSVDANTNMVALLKRIAQYSESLEVTDANGRLRMNMDAAGVFLFTSSNLRVEPMAAGQTIYNTNGNSAATFHSVPDVWKLLESSRSNFSNCIRDKITFS